MKRMRSLVLKLKAWYLYHKMSKILMIEKVPCESGLRIKVKAERDDINNDFWYEGLRKLGYVPFDPQRLEDEYKFMVDLESYINSSAYLCDDFLFGDDILRYLCQCFCNHKLLL